MATSRVQTLINKWRLRGSVDTKPQSGRPTQVSATTVSKIVQDAKKKEITSADKNDTHFYKIFQGMQTSENSCMFN